jgi:hypothetical protein
MTKHRTGTREEWLAARLELLETERELTRRSDELARRRQALKDQSVGHGNEVGHAGAYLISKIGYLGMLEGAGGMSDRSASVLPPCRLSRRLRRKTAPLLQ